MRCGLMKYLKHQTLALTPSLSPKERGSRTQRVGFQAVTVRAQVCLEEPRNGKT